MNINRREKALAKLREETLFKLYGQCAALPFPLNMTCAASAMARYMVAARMPIDPMDVVDVTMIGVDYPVRAGIKYDW